MFFGDASGSIGLGVVGRGDLLDERPHLDVVGPVAFHRLQFLPPPPRLDVGHQQVVVVPVDVSLLLGHLSLESQLCVAVLGRFQLQLLAELSPQLLVVQTTASAVATV